MRLLLAAALMLYAGPSHAGHEVHIYEGAGHGFVRAQDGREGANLKATQQAWPRVLSFLREHLRQR